MTVQEYETLKFEVDEGVARVTLNRPEAGNSLDMRLARELCDAALRCDEDPEVRAVLLSGAGNMFCVGGDLKSFNEMGDDLPRHLKELTTYFHAAVSRMARMDAPVVAAVQGAAAGGGFSLAISCDLVVAAENARFSMAYSKAGLTPDGSSTYYLPRLVGFKRAMDLALTGRDLSAQEALEWGLITRVAPDDDLIEESESLASQLAAGAARSLGVSKQLLHEGWTGTLETQMERQARAIAGIARTEDAREGISAFMEKRRPGFEGR